VKPKFVHYDLGLVEPDFQSPLTDLIIELDFLRKLMKGQERGCFPGVNMFLKD